MRTNGGRPSARRAAASSGAGSPANPQARASAMIPGASCACARRRVATGSVSTPRCYRDDGWNPGTSSLPGCANPRAGRGTAEVREARGRARRAAAATAIVAVAFVVVRNMSGMASTAMRIPTPSTGRCAAIMTGTITMIAPKGTPGTENDNQRRREGDRRQLGDGEVHAIERGDKERRRPVMPMPAPARKVETPRGRKNPVICSVTVQASRPSARSSPEGRQTTSANSSRRPAPEARRAQIRGRGDASDEAAIGYRTSTMNATQTRRRRRCTTPPHPRPRVQAAMRAGGRVRTRRRVPARAPSERARRTPPATHASLQ